MIDKYTILCVDDEEPILNSLKRALYDPRFRVLLANGGEQALRTLESEKIHLVISDQRMPFMNGSQLLKIVRNKYPNVIRIMLSGYSDFESLVSAINEGEVFRFISKPWENDELLAIVTTALKQREAIAIADRIVNDICALSAIMPAPTVESNLEKRGITVKINHGGDSFSYDAIADFINRILAAFDSGNDTTLRPSGGLLEKKSGALVFTFDIGKELILRIEMPEP